MHAHRLADRPAGFTGGQALDGFGLLVVAELGPAAKLDAFGFGRLAPVVGAFDDAVPLVLGHGGQEGDEAATERGGEVEVRLVQHLDQSAAGVDALDYVNA